MNKEDLKKRLEETKAKIKSNSKDAHFADALISDLLSLKGQLEHEPTLVHIAIDDIADSFDGEHFEMAVTKDGTAIYRTRGGYTLIADPRIVGLNATIQGFIAISKPGAPIPDDEKELLDLELNANAHVLNIPMIAFGDSAFKFDLATMVVKYLRETYENAINAPLQEEDKEADRVYEEGVKASINISDELKKTANE